MIVHFLDKTAYAMACFGLSFVVAQVDFFVLQRSVESFGTGVVIGVAFAAHADADAVFAKQIGVTAGGILNAPIRMMDETRPKLSLAKCHGQAGEREIRCQLRFQCTADIAPRERVEQHGQVDGLAKQPDVSDMGNPKLVDVC